MRTQQKRGGRRFPPRRKLCNQIYELDLAPRGVVSECLTGYLPSRPAKLILNVSSGLFDSLGASRAWPEINEALNLGKSFLAREFLPNLCLCRAQRASLNKRDEKKNRHALQSVSVKDRHPPMLLDWRSPRRTPYNFH